MYECAKCHEFPKQNSPENKNFAEFVSSISLLICTLNFNNYNILFEDIAENKIIKALKKLKIKLISGPNKIPFFMKKDCKCAFDGSYSIIL